jgi:hypothetical protein
MLPMITTGKRLPLLVPAAWQHWMQRDISLSESDARFAQGIDELC